MLTQRDLNHMAHPTAATKDVGKIRHPRGNRIEEFRFYCQELADSPGVIQTVPPTRQEAPGFPRFPRLAGDEGESQRQSPDPALSMPESGGLTAFKISLKNRNQPSPHP